VSLRLAGAIAGVIAGVIAGAITVHSVVAPPGELRANAGVV